jgi:hypothetical protein
MIRHASSSARLFSGPASATRVWLQLAVVLLPILAAAIMLLPQWPGLIDLPGHVARYHVELELNHDPRLQQYFQFHWALIPNLGIDLLIYPFARILGLDLAVRVCVALIPAISVIGMLAPSNAAHRRIPATSLVALPCAFGYPLVFGFVNYCFSAALALVAAAIWLRLTLSNRTRSRLIFGIIASPVLFVAHLTGWGLFGLMAFGIVFAAQQSSGPARAVLSAIMACLPLAWPLILLIANLAMGTGNAGLTHGWFDFREMGLSAVGVLREQSFPIDLASTVILFLTALLPLIARAHFAYERLLLIPALLVWVAVVMLPGTMLGSDFANVRLIPSALALTILAVRPIVPLPVYSWIGAAGFYAFRLAVTASALLNFDAIAQQQLQAINHLTPGSRVLGFKLHACARSWAPPRSQNLNLLATERRDVFTNGHFAESGAQLLSITYPLAVGYTHIGTNAVMNEPCPRWNVPTLAQALANAPLSAFDYVWLIDVPGQQLPSDSRLKLIWHDAGSTLYAVVLQ